MAKSNVSAAPAQVADPEVAAVWVDIKDLKRWADNPRRNEKAVPKVMASMKRFGWGAPILARKADGEIIAGHTRLSAAEALGMTRAPVRFLDLDPADAHLLALADNKLNEVAEWDDAAVARILSDYGLDDAEIAGWDSAALDKMAADLVGSTGVNDPAAEWAGMPEFVQEDKTAFRSIPVHFKDQTAVDAFAALVGQTITEKTRFLWFPEIEIESYADKRYAADGA